MRATLGLLLLLAALTGASSGGRAQQASPVPGCSPRPATPYAEFQTVNQEIAVDLDRLFGCLAVGDWAVVASFVAIPTGLANPFTSLDELDRTGLFVVRTGMVSQTMRSSGPSGSTVDLAWRVGSQLRYDRWTFQKLDGQWRIVLVEPGLPLFDGTIVGMEGKVGPEGVTLARTWLVNPGGIELVLEVAPETPTGGTLLVFTVDACTRPQPTPLAGMLEVRGDSITLFLDAPADGDYALVVIGAGEQVSREAICGATAAVLTMSS